MQSVCFQHAKAHIIRTCIVYSAISFFPTCKRTHTTHPHNFIGWELRTAIGRETPTWLTHQSRQTIPQPFFAWKYIKIKTLQGRLAQNFSFCETSKSLRFCCCCSKDHLYFPKISILFSQIYENHSRYTLTMICWMRTMLLQGSNEKLFIRMRTFSSTAPCRRWGCSGV